MDINQVLKQLDELFAQHQIREVEPFLLEKMEAARRLGDTGAMITLLNELIGHYRETGESEKSIAACKQVLELMDQLELCDHTVKCGKCLPGSRTFAGIHDLLSGSQGNLRAGIRVFRLSLCQLV